MDRRDVNQRARKILQAVINEYLHSGDAVGSRTVARRHGIQLSPATVRNVMADLEELGLLTQPHTSAGRVPTEDGLRFFIDSLLKVRALSSKEKQEIRDRCGPDVVDFDDVIQRTSKMLSEVTRCVGVVMTPDPGLQRYRHVEFVPLRADKYLCVLVTTDGHIENRVFQSDVELDDARLGRIHNYLDELLTGMTLAEMKTRVVSELGEVKNRYDGMVSAALRLSQAALEQAEAGADVIVSGQSNLLREAATASDNRWKRMRELLETLEDKEVLLRLLDRSLSGDGIQVFLGGETAHTALSESSVIATPYGSKDQPLGAIAVIGPRRMNYGKVMSIVDFTATLVSRIISEP